MIWTKKYEPKNSQEVQGQDKAVSELKSYIQNYKNQKQRAIFLYGQSGNGKTSAVYAVANELGLELLEVNASDFRTPELINEKLGNAIKQRSLFGKSKVILFDEVDGLSGSKDRGGISALTKLLAESKFPIVLTANDPFDKKFSTLRKKSKMIEFTTLAYTSILSYLKKICDSEGINYNEDDLKALARRAGGDLRGAIIDLQILCSGKNELAGKALEELSGRKQTESMINALVKVFKTTKPEIALSAFDNVDEDIDKIMLWIDENLPKEYKKAEDLAQAYDWMSKADVYRGRIRRWQHWRFLVYINQLLTAGIALSKKERYNDYVAYTPTKRILKLWMANMKNLKRNAIAEKVAEHVHSSKKEVIKDTMPYLQYIFKNNDDMAEKIAQELELDDEEVMWLQK